MSKELLEMEAVEEPAIDGEVVAEDQRRPLPEPAKPTDVEAFRAEIKTAALAAAGGIVAGVATVAAAKAVGHVGSRRAVSKAVRRRHKMRPANVIASRSFLIDVHVLDR